jgi:thioredoxin 1
MEVKMTINVTSSNFEKEVVKSEIPVIIDFWASWCGPCQMMGPVFEDLSKDFDGKLKFAKVNVEEEESLPAQFGVSGIPCLIVTKKGKEIDRIVGFAPKEVLREKIKEII